MTRGTDGQSNFGLVKASPLDCWIDARVSLRVGHRLTRIHTWDKLLIGGLIFGIMRPSRTVIRVVLLWVIGMGRVATIAIYALMLCVVKFTHGYSPFVLTVRVTVHLQILVFSFLTISGRLVQVIPWFTYLLNRWEEDLVCYLRSLCIQIFYKLAKGNQFQALWNTCVCNKDVKCVGRCRSLFYVVSKDTGARTRTRAHTLKGVIGY